MLVTAATIACAQEGAAAPAPAAPAAAPAPAAAAPDAPAAAPAVPPAAPAPASSAPLYTVVDGNKVDENTFAGWKTWRAMACERCHGANQEGLVGPSLVDNLKTMSKADFVACVMQGRVEKGMPNFGGIESVVKNIDNLYAFLKGRSDGAIATGHLQKISN